ncbi:glycerol-3-phosphate 1-O-acyltransferase PlsY, partial [Mycoplasma tauri]
LVMNIFYSILSNLSLVLLGYILGSFNTSIILSKTLKKQDIRNFNSHNAGATNTLRTFGKKFALIVFLIDVFKTLIPIIILSALFNHVEAISTFSSKYFLSPQSIGLGVVIGHISPIFYNFKGGKGVACSLGFILANNILFLLIAFVIFMSIVGVTKFVSLGSILTSSILIIFFWVPWFISGILGYWFNNVDMTNKFLDLSDHWYVSSIIYTIISVLVVISHHKNIVKLINKTENKLSFNKIK